MKARSSALPVATVNPLRPDHMNPNSARSALSPARRLAAAAFGLAVVAIVGACGEGSGSTCATCDTGRPVVTVSRDVDHRLVDRASRRTPRTTSACSRCTRASAPAGHRRRLRHDVHERRDLGRHSVHRFRFRASVPTGTTVTVVATAMDGAHNVVHARHAACSHTGDGRAAEVQSSRIRQSTDTAVVGFSLAVSVSGKAAAKVKALGFIASGVFATPVRDSMLYHEPAAGLGRASTRRSILVGATHAER